MLDFFQHLVYWHWLLFAVVLLILELLTGSGFLFWMGISALAVSGVLWLVPGLSAIVQLLGFAVLAMLTAFSWWFYLKNNPIKTDRPVLNRRGEQYVGRVFTLDAPIVNGVGVVHVDDSTWRVQCVDLPAGAKIRITGVDGVILLAKEEL